MKISNLVLFCVLVCGNSALMANNIITAEHPPFGGKGYALQFDNRVIFSGADTFVSRSGAESRREAGLASDLFITRLYIPGWLFRVSLQYSRLEINDKAHSGPGDLVAEAGLSREYGDWRWRALLFANAPLAEFSPSRVNNTGAGAWSVGPNISVTRYLDDKKYDLDLWAQYSVNFTNPENRKRAGNSLCYALAASRLLDLGLPVRAALEQRGLFASPDSKGGSSAGNWGRTQLSAGPSFMVNMQQYLPGFTLWPTAQFDIYNRNTARTALYYLKLQYNW